MTYEDGKILRMAWSGGECQHPEVDKEYHKGNSTGDYICTTCGAELTQEQKNNR